MDETLLQQPEEQRQAMSEPVVGPTGRVKNAGIIRVLKDREQFERYDTVMIGEGQSAISKGYFDTFQAAGKTTHSNVDLAYTNQTSDRYDYAQDLYTCEMEFLAPTMIEEFEEDAASTLYATQMWTQQCPQHLGMNVLLADADIIAQSPASTFLAGKGSAGAFATDSAGGIYSGGTNGTPAKGNGWSWPEPIMVTAKANLTVKGWSSQWLRDALSQMPPPGAKLIPDGSGGRVRVPNLYGIRITFRGPRYLQLRGTHRV
jgi:hypothetical protein